jgi:hypothetical protein
VTIATRHDRMTQIRDHGADERRVRICMEVYSK